jgi:hypothetical protein
MQSCSEPEGRKPCSDKKRGGNYGGVRQLPKNLVGSTLQAPSLEVYMGNRTSNIIPVDICIDVDEPCFFVEN